MLTCDGGHVEVRLHRVRSPPLLDCTIPILDSVRLI